MVENQSDQELVVHGSTLQGFAQACINLNIVAGSQAGSLLAGIEMTGWYPFERLQQIERVVIDAYESAGPILERVGMEMMLGWYHFGPGKEIISKGIDFLEFQSGSQGYHSVVKGPKELVGSFDLVELNEKKGYALIHSTSPFNKDQERGVIIGGMSSTGDLDFIDVDNSEDVQRFVIEFH